MYDVLQTIVPTTIFFAAPLIFTALGGVFSERSGVVNIGLEGLMTIGAFVGIVFNLTFADRFGEWTPWLALLAAMVVGAVFSLLHAVASVTVSRRPSRKRGGDQRFWRLVCRSVFSEENVRQGADGPNSSSGLTKLTCQC